MADQDITKTRGLTKAERRGIFSVGGERYPGSEVEQEPNAPEPEAEEE